MNAPKIQAFAAIVFLAASAAGCVTRPVDPATQMHEARRVYEDYWQAYLRLDTLMASEAGVHDYDAVYPNNISESYRSAWRKLESDALAQAVALDDSVLVGDARWLHQAFVFQRRVALERLDYPDHLLPLNQFMNHAAIFAHMGSGRYTHPFKTTKDYENFLARMDGFAVWMDQAIRNMREGIRRGIVLPRGVTEQVIDQLNEYADASAQDSPFWVPVQNMPPSMSDADQRRLVVDYRQKIERTLLPAYRRVRDFMREEYLPAAREGYAYAELPDGIAWYRSAVHEMTGRDADIEYIHSLGLREVARLQREIAAVQSELGFKGRLQEFFRYMNESEKFQPRSAEALLALAESVKSRVAATTGNHFSLMPARDYLIEEMDPVIGRRWSGAYYQAGAADGSRDAVVAVNTTNLPSRLTWIVPVMMLHEGSPGHHYQRGIQQTLDVPDFQEYIINRAFNEGWATYAETLGLEIGAYDDPASHFGVLNSQLWRAVRLVVDTGLHARGWTREQAIDYMRANSASSEAFLQTEIDRYAVWPGQALSYMVGAVTFRQLRERSEARLGEEFDLGEFHRVVLEAGSLPLAVLEEKVQRWLDARVSEQRQASKVAKE